MRTAHTLTGLSCSWIKAGGASMWMLHLWEGGVRRAPSRLGDMLLPHRATRGACPIAEHVWEQRFLCTLVGRPNGLVMTSKRNECGWCMGVQEPPLNKPFPSPDTPCTCRALARGMVEQEGEGREGSPSLCLPQAQEALRLHAPTLALAPPPPPPPTLETAAATTPMPS